MKNFEQDTKNLKKNVFPKCIFNENNLKTAISCALDHYPKKGPEGSQQENLMEFYLKHVKMLIIGEIFGITASAIQFRYTVGEVLLVQKE